MSYLDETQLIQQFLTGWNQLYERKDPTGARNRFEYCRQKSEIPHADLFRALAACQPDAEATDAQVVEIFNNLDTFGHLTVAMAAATNDPNPPEQWAASPPVTYRLGLDFCDFPLKLTTRNDVHSFAAWIKVNSGDYQGAKGLLDAVTARTGTTDLVESLLFYRTGRWTEAITVAGRIRAAILVDQLDNPVADATGVPAENVVLCLLSRLISGTAWAYLDSPDSARAQLQEIIEYANAGNWPQIPAEAHRILGLIERRAGHEQQAQQHFSRGRALSVSQALTDALADTTLTLTVTSSEMIDQRSDYWDLATEPSLAHHQQAQAGSAKAAVLERATSELNAQIGMTAVKQQVDDLRKDVLYRAEMKRRGKDAKERSNHIVFSGPPGTGKTTIAKVISDQYFGLGITRNNNLVVTGRSDLVAGYEGQSGLRTQEVLNDAMGGVLFIDEAYELIQDRQGSSNDVFGQEVVTKLLTALEDHRDDLVVIIAGYEGELRRFIATNEGLKSRFTNWIRFESYSAAEVADIARYHADSNGSLLTDEAHKQIIDVVNTRVIGLKTATGKPMIDEAGNGRFARNVVERAERYRGRRLGDLDLTQLTDEQLMEISRADVDQALTTLINEFH